MVLGRSLHHALDRDPIFRAVSSFYGITTADGNIGGTTLFCSALIGSNDFITNKTILLESGLSIYEDKGATAFNPLTGQITVNPAFSAQVLAGTGFYILNATSLSAVTPVLAQYQGLCYYGVVTDVPVAGQFTIATLAGLGASKFATVVPEYQYHAFVLRDASGPGAAPHMESRPVSNYATLTGNFTANAFTMPVGIGDEILIIHPYLARVMNLYGLPPVTGAVADTWSTGFAISGLAGGDLVTLGAALARYKLHSLLVNISTLTPGALITVRMFMLVTGAERMVYQQTFTQGVDPNGLWIVNGTLAIHEALRVEVYSNVAGDDGRNIDYDYMLEAM